MTLLEKARQIHPHATDYDIKRLCPSAYNFEEKSMCPNNFLLGCKECWDREYVEEIKSELITDAMVIEVVEKFANDFKDIEIIHKETGLPLSEYVQHFVSNTEEGIKLRKTLIRVALHTMIEVLDK